MFKNSAFILGLLIFSSSSSNVAAQNFTSVSDVYVIEDGSFDTEESEEEKVEYFTVKNVAIATALVAVIATTTYLVWKKFSARTNNAELKTPPVATSPVVTPPNSTRRSARIAEQGNASPVPNFAAPKGAVTPPPSYNSAQSRRYSPSGEGAEDYFGGVGGTPEKSNIGVNSRVDGETPFPQRTLRTWLSF